MALTLAAKSLLRNEAPLGSSQCHFELVSNRSLTGSSPPQLF